MRYWINPQTGATNAGDIRPGDWYYMGAVMHPETQTAIVINQQVVCVNSLQALQDAGADYVRIALIPWPT